MNPAFSFPFIPYSIQEKFMKELYLTIEDQNLGIFESPTGTGKSLSICCSALQWLKDNEQRNIENIEREINELKLAMLNGAGTDDWLQEEYEKIKMTQSLALLQCKLDKIKKRIDLLNVMKLRVLKTKNNQDKFDIKYKFANAKESKENKDNVIENEQDDMDLIIQEEERENSESDIDEVIENDNESDNFNKIYISSRTHSQLSQFIGEIKRTIFKNDTRVVTLASRQHYCVNTDVIKLKNVNLINERCLDLQKSKQKPTAVGDDGKVLKRTKTSSCTSCPYYNQTNISKLKERILVDIMDMEDLVSVGKELKACPYYASRIALEDAEVVLISHAGIVSAGARSGMDLKLQDNILILDEAHGLTAALENAHSAPVTMKQLISVKNVLQLYIKKYGSRMSSRNLLTLNQLSFVVGKLLGLVKISSKPQDDTKIHTLESFLLKAEVDHINLRPLVEFCRNTRFARKLHGFSMRYSQQALDDELKSASSKKNSFESFLSNIAKKKTDNVIENKSEEKTSLNTPTEYSAGSGLYAILDFLERLCDRSDNGRVLTRNGGDSGLLKYLLLNPAESFQEVVKQCRSVILAGGTMEPISEFQNLLTCSSHSKLQKVNIVKCDHVVSSENVLAVCLSKGPSNVNLNLSYENRMSKQLLTEVGCILRNLCSVVPGGVVCFLPSYSYENAVYEHLVTSKIVETINKKKTVFREPKSAAEVDQILNKFSLAVKNKDNGRNGALMLSVVGGKLSEGLNFSDDLGRCVIVVGMPYPNIKSAELQEKMNYLNRVSGGNAGNLYYENLCMKAVNQCIGRAVRHANDYACVMLVDERYSRQQTVSALPSFVQKSLMSNCTFGQSFGSIVKFFSKHNKK